VWAGRIHEQNVSSFSNFASKPFAAISEALSNAWSDTEVSNKRINTPKQTVLSVTAQEHFII
jgi:hypothetical protein